MTIKRVLILGGTTEANQLAELLVSNDQLEVITSRAGVTKVRKQIAGKERLGGFGGIEGLKKYLTENNINAVIDATHPFAQTITDHAFLACKDLKLLHLILSRQTWKARKGDDWITVPDISSALCHLHKIKKPQRVFITTGQKELSAFAAISQHHFLARMIEAPDLDPLPDNLEILFERGPFSLSEEKELLRRHRIGMIVTKNSGGTATIAKLEAARDLSLPVLMITRPLLPPAQIVESAQAAVTWLSQKETG